MHDDEVRYVGQSKTILNRIAQHRTDKTFTVVRYIAVPADKIGAVEAAFIRYLKPRLNTTFKNKPATREDELLIAEYLDVRRRFKIQPPPKQGAYGPVAFYEEDDIMIDPEDLEDFPDAKMATGIYDDDCSEECDEGCPSIEILEQLKARFGDKVPNADFQWAFDECVCAPKAIVLIEGTKSTYTVPRRFLFCLRSEKDQEIEEAGRRATVMTLASQYGVDPELLWAKLEAAEKEGREYHG